MSPPIGVTLLLLSAAGAGCSHRPSARVDRRPEVVLAPDGAAEVRVRVELAITEKEQQLGLMHRDKLEPGWGMLFLNERPRHLSFWMHNCRFPIDMVFITSDRRVLGVVESAEPFTDTPRSVEGESQYVLEVPGSFAHYHGIRAGTRVTFVDID